jgi:hypothetical protein
MVQRGPLFMAKRCGRWRNGNIVFKFIIVDNRGISANDELSSSLPSTGKV